MDDLWSPERPLPDTRVLRAMAERICRIWRMDVLGAAAEIAYNPRMRTALGRAFLTRTRVELNPRLLGANPRELLPTLAHELAHLAVHARFGKVQAHGLHFRSLMCALGLRGRATHRCDVSSLRRRRGKYLYLHLCSDCRRRFVAAGVRRNCYCRHCGPGMTWDVFRLPNTPEGRQMVEEAMAK